MSTNDPGNPPDPEGVPGVEPEVTVETDDGFGGTWVWIALVVAVALALFLAIARPWADGDEVIDAVESPTAEATETPTEQPTDEPTPTEEPTEAPTVVPAFDGADFATLFVAQAALEATIPNAQDGLEPGATGGEQPWGLPDGVEVSPDTCVLAETVVADEPAEYDLRTWANDTVRFRQDVTVLPDAEAAQEAFAALVSAVDACGEYSVGEPETGQAVVTASPATEAQGIFPSLYQDQASAAEGEVVVSYHGHVLVENAIVTWTATVLPPADTAGDRVGLGPAEDIDALVQEQAQDAVTALG